MQRVYDGPVRSAYLALFLLACSQGGTVPAGTGDEPNKPTSTPPAAPLDPRCEKVRPHVEDLYRKAPADKDKALADDLLAANVTMVMNDCGLDPDRVAPCAERARDAAELEHSCLIPLDDEGAVDGDRLKGK